MACYGCGSPNGEQFRLCPECIARRKSEHVNTRSKALQQNRGEHVQDAASTILNSELAQVAGLLVLLLILFGLFMLKGPLIKHGAVASLLFAGMISCFIVSTLVWALFWTRMLVMDTLWGIFSMLFPFLIYRYVLVRWDEPAIRKFFFVHIACLVMAVGLGAGLAKNLNIPILRVYDIYWLYTHGARPMVDSQGQVWSADNYENTTEGGDLDTFSGYESDSGN